MAVEDILKKGVKVTLDKERTLMYPMAAMGYLAEVYGSVGEAFDAFEKVMPKDEKAKKAFKLTAPIISTLTHFVTAGLRAEDPSITYNEVYCVLDMGNMPGMISAVSQTITNWMPVVKEEEKGARPSPPRSK